MDDSPPAILTVEEWASLESDLPYSAKLIIRLLRVKHNQAVNLKQYKGLKDNLGGINIMLHEFGKPYRLAIHRNEHSIDFYLARN